jgi:hypothetical protein
MKTNLNFRKPLPLLLLLLGTSVFAAEEGMTSMPKISPKRTFQVTDGQVLSEDAGFGKNEPQVKMMNLMMVEGSGMEGMDMGGMKMADAKASGSNQPMAGNSAAMEKSGYLVSLKAVATTAKVGSNRIQFQVKDKKSGSALKGLKLKAEVYMTSMDMGTETPAVRETSPGNYEVKAPFSMEGPWALKLIFPSGESEVLPYTVNSK